MSGHNHTAMPIWTWLAPLIATGLLVLKFAHIVPSEAPLVLIAAAVLLGTVVFASVHHAEELALKLGEPFGSILLAVAVTVIEVALIVSIMLTGVKGSEAVARDTVYAAVMIVLNGVIGLCLVIGGTRHFEQTFQLQGASSALAVLGTLVGLTLILPNYTLAAAGPSFSTAQALLIGAASLVLWCVFVFVQTIKHRDYFLDAPAAQDLRNDAETQPETMSNQMALVRLGLLLVSLATVVLLAKTLSYPLDMGIAAAGLPQAFAGVVIAAIVLLPEGMAAAKSAVRNQLQNSINLALGSAIASIGLTIPTVAIVALILDRNLVLGASPANITLMVLTLFVSTLTLGTGRTTVLQGAIHLVLFAVFLMVSAIP